MGYRHLLPWIKKSWRARRIMIVLEKAERPLTGRDCAERAGLSNYRDGCSVLNRLERKGLVIQVSERPPGYKKLGLGATYVLTERKADFAEYFNDACTEDR